MTSNSVAAHEFSWHTIPLRRAAALVLLLVMVGLGVGMQRYTAAMKAATIAREKTERWQFFKTAERATDFALIRLDAQGRVFSWNKGAESILGWTKAERRGQKLDVLTIPGVNDEVMGLVLSDSPLPWRLIAEADFKTQDGGRCRAWITSRDIDANGEKFRTITLDPVHRVRFLEPEIAGASSAAHPGA